MRRPSLLTRRGRCAFVNGDFSDLSELTPFGGSGWYQGVPAGWRASSKTPCYSVHAGADGKQPACNVSQLGVLEQNVGTLTQAADVVLTMDVADEWRKGAELNTEIQDADGETLGSIQLKAGRTQRLVAGKVPAGTTIIIRFQALNGTTPALDNVSVASFASGSQAPTPQVKIRRFQPDQPLARARRAASVSADLENLGAEDIELDVTLSLPAGVRAVKSNVAKPLRINSSEGWSRLTWSLEAAEPMAADMVLELKAMNGSPVAYQPLRMLFLPPVEKSTPPYIPEPVPAPTSMLVGAHHCPLWEADKPQMWLNVLKHPERTPALGFYSQENPEVSDWETKWAVEHGISFFVYCWYRTGQGGAVKTRFGSAIHDALFKSRFVNKMKFTLMWENQSRGQAGVADERDLFTNLLPYWMENYFQHPSYLKVDNKPVLFIYRPEFLVDDLGGVTNVAKAFSRMREVCRESGFDGLYLLGEYRGTDPKHLELMKSLGLDYTFAYCWYVPGSPTPERAMQAQLDYLRKTQELNILPQVVTVSQAWSGWQDEGTIWKIPPPQFETLLRQAKEFTATLPKEQLGSRMLLLDNWNEWGEGHYLAPYREYGFGYLDAVRKVFSTAPEEHRDLLPEDIGRGPYDAAVRAHFEALEQKERLLSKRAVKAARRPDWSRGGRLMNRRTAPWRSTIPVTGMAVSSKRRGARRALKVVLWSVMAAAFSSPAARRWAGSRSSRSSAGSGPTSPLRTIVGWSTAFSATTPPAVFGWGCCVANPVSKCRRLPGAITSAVTSRFRPDDGCIWPRPSTAPRCDSTWTAKSAAPCPALALFCRRTAASFWAAMK